jgi:hypothetical protein
MKGLPGKEGPKGEKGIIGPHGPRVRIYLKIVEKIIKLYLITIRFENRATQVHLVKMAILVKEENQDNEVEMV